MVRNGDIIFLIADNTRVCPRLRSKFWYSEENVWDFSKVSSVLILLIYIGFSSLYPASLCFSLVGFHVVFFHVLLYVWLDT